jgi:flagellar basal-body rod protein FlgB
MSVLFDNLHNGLVQVLDVRQKQHALTTGNVANADTPHYKAKFIAFDELLAETMQEGDMLLSKTHPMHVSNYSGGVESPTVQEIEAPPWSLDGNSVNMEREMVRLKENALMFRTILKGISARVARLGLAAGN